MMTLLLLAQAAVPAHAMQLLIRAARPHAAIAAAFICRRIWGAVLMSMY